MPTPLDSILKLEVPVVVRLAKRKMTAGEIVLLVPGSIIELPKDADDELDLMINNRQIGSGNAVKIGENFGVRISYVGDMAMRAEAMGETSAPGELSEAEELERMAAELAGA